MNEQILKKIIESQPSRTALQQPFYIDGDIYQRDIEQVYLKSWLYAGHLSEIPKTGDWFLFEKAGQCAVECLSSPRLENLPGRARLFKKTRLPLSWLEL